MSRARSQKRLMPCAAICAALMIGVAINHTVSAAAEESSDDLICAARYTLAAFAVQNLDTDAAAYYAVRANAAGKRYLQTHPGETERSYEGRVTERARSLQEQLATKTLSAESLVQEIVRCDEKANSLLVL